MAKSILIIIEPAVLKYARNNSGYSIEQISKKAKIPVEQLQKYEEEQISIPLSHLERFAKIYKRPLAFFLLPKVPSELVEPKEFRIVYASEEHPHFSPKYYLAIRRSRYIQDIFSDLTESKFQYDFPEVSLRSDPDKLAEWFRIFLDFPFELQKKRRTPNVALREWKNAIENKNIFILQFNLSKENISAFCLTDKKPYIIGLNSQEHEYRRIFSLFHEIGHILLKKSGICTPDNLSRNSYQYIEIEKFCNQFAASFLLPHQFIQDRGVSNLIHSSFSSWTQNDLKELGGKFGVSKETFLRRLLTLNYINNEQYELWRKKWIHDFDEQEEKPKANKEIRIPQYVLSISQNGRAFTSFVLDQLHTNRLTYTNVSEILNLAPKHIQVLESKI